MVSYLTFEMLPLCSIDMYIFFRWATHSMSSNCDFFTFATKLHNFRVREQYSSPCFPFEPLSKEQLVIRLCPGELARGLS